MTEGDDVAPQRRMVRCPEGHIFDAAARDNCPVCGAKASALSAPQAEAVAEPSQSKSPSMSPQRRRILIVSAGAVIFALFAVIMLRGGPADEKSNGNPAQAARKQEQSQKESTASILGAWELDVPMPQGGVAHWTIEFDRQGHYKFSDVTNGASHEGDYSAVNGAWSINGAWTRNPVLSPGTPYVDGGSFRLPTSDSLELQGRAGTGLWSRVRN